MYAKHTLLPDTLVGSAGMLHSERFFVFGSPYQCLTLPYSRADYPISRISSGEQLRVPLVDKSGDSTGELNMSVNTGGYGSESTRLLLVQLAAMV